MSEQVTVIGKITPDWNVKDIGNISKLNQGKTFPRKYQNSKGDIDVVKIEDFSDGRLRVGNTKNKITKKESEELGFEVNDTIRIGTPRTGQAVYSTNCRLIPEGSVYDDNVITISPNSANTTYIYYIFRHASAKNYTNNSTVPSTTQGLLSLVSVALPELTEQRRIASVLYMVDQHVTKLDKRYETLCEHKQALMQDLLEPDESWDRLNPTDIADINPDSFDQDAYDVESIPYLSLSCVSNGKLVDTESTSTSDPVGSATRVVKEDDVLIGTVRPRQKSHYRVTEDEDGFVASSGFVVLRPTEIEPKYLEQIILSRDFFKQMDAYGTGSTYPSVNLGDIMNMSIPVPSSEEQERIASILYTVDEMIACTQRSCEEHEQLKQGLMQDLLTGTVRTPKSLQVSLDVVQRSTVAE